MSPLISIGIPTFNRPTGLAAALACVTGQSYANIEIIVSDNASTDPAVGSTLKAFSERDTRITCFTQEKNIGASDNFAFTMANASSNYFIWLADDDLWPPHHLESLMSAMTQDTLCVFPDIVQFSEKENWKRSGYLSTAYRGCRSDADYLVAWCNSGAGFPFYGLYNRAALRRCGIEVEVVDSLKYFNEGLFLHRIFINGGVRMTSKTALVYNADSNKPQQEQMVSDYIEYTRYVAQLYLETNRFPSPLKRDDLLKIIMRKHAGYLCHLLGLKPKDVGLMDGFGRGRKRLTMLRRLRYATRVLACGR